MKEIQGKHITIGFLSMILAVVFLAAGFVYPWCWFFSAAFLLVYFFLDRNHLRCPHRGGFMNLDRLLYAKSHRSYCWHCGKEIHIR